MLVMDGSIRTCTALKPTGQLRHPHAVQLNVAATVRQPCKISSVHLGVHDNFHDSDRYLVSTLVKTMSYESAARGNCAGFHLTGKLPSLRIVFENINHLYGQVLYT